MMQSSTYFTSPQDVCKSFMWCLKPIGPNIVPCGTPALIVVKSDFTLPSFTRCLRWHRKDVSHLMMTFGSPTEVHLVSRVNSIKSFAKIDEKDTDHGFEGCRVHISTRVPARSMRAQWVFLLLNHIV